MEINIHVSDVQLKIIAIGLIPVFIILSVTLPKTLTTYILLGMVMLTALVVSYIGMSMEKKAMNDPDDLLAIPPKNK